MKIKLAFCITVVFGLTACITNLKNRQVEILFDSLESNISLQNDSIIDTLKSAFATFDVETLDSSHLKEFWFNAYVFQLENISKEQFYYLDYGRFMNTTMVIANQKMTTSELIEKIKGFDDPRMLLALDFLTTTSSKTRRTVLKEDVDIELDSISYSLINDPSFVRVKKDLKTVFYPQHFDWLLGADLSKILIKKYHKNTAVLGYKYKQYPFSPKLRN